VNGVASLGADGLVPATQLPPSATPVPLVARVGAGGAVVTTAIADVTGLAVDITVGTWHVEVEGHALVASGAGLVGGYLTGINGLVIAAGPVNTSTPGTANAGRMNYDYGSSGANYARGVTSWTPGSTPPFYAPIAQSAGQFTPFRWWGHLVVTTAGRLKMQASNNSTATSGSSYVDAFTTLTATRIG
jgi:hypothetical protein